MSKKKEEKDILKAYEISSETNDFTPDIAKGQYRFLLLVVFLLLGITIALFIFHVLAVKLRSDLTDENSKNPLFSVGQDENDNNLPKIPGEKVYDIRKDVNEIEKNMDTQQKEFNEKLKADNSDKKKARELEMLKKRDQFAGERLELLKKIDQAKTKEERIKAIKELEKLAGGKN